MVILVLPFNILLLLGLLSSLVLTASYLHVFVVLQIAIVVILNGAILKVLYFRRKNEVVQVFYSNLKEMGARESSQIFFRAVLTSWISPCAVWANNGLLRTKFLLHSAWITLTVNICCLATLYAFGNIKGLLFYDNPPILHCMADTSHFTVGRHDIFQGGLSFVEWIRICDSSDTCLPRVRVCSKNEKPTELLEKYVLPTVLGLQLLGFLASAVLQWLGNYPRMFSLSNRLCLLSPRLYQHCIMDQLLDPKPDKQMYQRVLDLVRKSEDFAAAADQALESLVKLTRGQKSSGQLKILLRAFLENTERKTRSVWKGRPPLHQAALNGQTSKWCFLGIIGGKVGARNGQNDSSISLISVKIAIKDLRLDRQNFVTRWWIRQAQNSENALHSATKLADVSMMRVLLENGRWPDKDHLGSRPLDLAVKNKHNEAVKLLLEYGASVDFADYMNTDAGDLKFLLEQVGTEFIDGQGRSPLHLAAVTNNLVCMQLLLEHHADENAEDPTGMRPLHFAAQAGSSGCTELLLSYAADCNVEDDNGLTPLHHAALTGSNDCLEVLLSSSANVNALDNKGRTPLHCAAQSGSRVCLETLVSKFACVNAQDFQGMTPLHCAASAESRSCLKFLLDSGADSLSKNAKGQTPLDLAVRSGDKHCLKLLVHTRDQKGLTPLHQAALIGFRDSILLLLDNGADVNARDNQGKTPMHYAAQIGSRDCLALLLHYNADSRAQDNNGMTALHLAASAGYENCLELLVDNTASTLSKDARGTTPLHGAGSNRNCLSLMARAKDERGSTPLHHAAKTSDMESMVLLLGNSADVNARDANGLTPLHFAARTGNTDCLKLLLDHKADTNVTDNSGLTPFHHAYHSGQKRHVLVLL